MKGIDQVRRAHWNNFPDALANANKRKIREYYMKDTANNQQSSFNGLNALQMTLEKFVDAATEKALCSLWPQATSQFFCICCNRLSFETEADLKQHETTEKHMVSSASFNTTFCKACQCSIMDETEMASHCGSELHKVCNMIMLDMQKLAPIYWKVINNVADDDYEDDIPLPGTDLSSVDVNDDYIKPIRIDKCTLCRHVMFDETAEVVANHTASEKHKQRAIVRYNKNGQVADDWLLVFTGYKCTLCNQRFGKTDGNKNKQAVIAHRESLSHKEKLKQDITSTAGAVCENKELQTNCQKGEAAIRLCNNEKVCPIADEVRSSGFASSEDSLVDEFITEHGCSLCKRQFDMPNLKLKLRHQFSKKHQVKLKPHSQRNATLPDAAANKNIPEYSTADTKHGQGKQEGNARAPISTAQLESLVHGQSIRNNDKKTRRQGKMKRTLEIPSIYQNLDIDGLDQKEFIIAAFERVMGVNWPQPKSEFHCRCCNYKEFHTKDELDAHMVSKEHKTYASSYDVAFCLTCQVHSVDAEGVAQHSKSEHHIELSKLLDSTKEHAKDFWEKWRNKPHFSNKGIEDTSQFEFITDTGCKLCDREFFTGNYAMKEKHFYSNSHQKNLKDRNSTVVLPCSEEGSSIGASTNTDQTNFMSTSIVPSQTGTGQNKRKMETQHSIPAKQHFPSTQKHMVGNDWDALIHTNIRHKGVEGAQSYFQPCAGGESSHSFRISQNTFTPRHDENSRMPREENTSYEDDFCAWY